MKTNEIERDIPVILSVYTLIIVLGLYIHSEYKQWVLWESLNKTHQTIHEQRVEIDVLHNNLVSMNKYADTLEGRLDELSYLDKLLKDLWWGE